MQEDDLLINILKGSQVCIPHKVMTIEGEKKKEAKMKHFFETVKSNIF